MKGMNVKLLTLCASVLLLTSCEKEEDLNFSKTDPLHEEGNCDVISFNNMEAGTGEYVDEVWADGGYGPIEVRGRARNSSGTFETGNRAILFDSQNPTGDDVDLRTTNWGNVLIVQEIGVNPIDTDGSDYDGPNDNQWGARMVLTFPEPVTLQSMNVLDIDKREGDDENNSWVRLYDENNNLIKQIYLEQRGNNVGFEVDLQNTPGVKRMVVLLDGVGNVGSGAIDDIRFCWPEEEMGCTRTQGYWKNHSYCKDKGNGKGKGNDKYDNTWNGFQNHRIAMIDDATYCEILWMSPKGDANIILAHQFIAAELNIAADASAPDEVDAVMADARLYFAGELTGVSRAELISWAELLDRYNNGLIGPGHCDD